MTTKIIEFTESKFKIIPKENHMVNQLLDGNDTSL
jgi:hypothetical protein